MEEIGVVRWEWLDGRWNRQEWLDSGWKSKDGGERNSTHQEKTRDFQAKNARIESSGVVMMRPAGNESGGDFEVDRGKWNVESVRVSMYI